MAKRRRRKKVIVRSIRALPPMLKGPAELPSDLAWYVAQVQSPAATAIERALREKEYGVYVPRSTELATPRKASRVPRRPVSKPLLPGYVFVGLRSDQSHYGAMVEGVTRFLHYPGQIDPARIPAAFVHELRDREADGDFSTVPGHRAGKAKPDFEVGKAVKIMQGPFAGFDGVIERIAGAATEEQRVSVWASIFGRPTLVEVGAGGIEAAKAA